MLTLVKEEFDNFSLTTQAALAAKDVVLHKLLDEIAELKAEVKAKDQAAVSQHAADEEAKKEIADLIAQQEMWSDKVNQQEDKLAAGSVQLSKARKALERALTSLKEERANCKQSSRDLVAANDKVERLSGELEAAKKAIQVASKQNGKGRGHQRPEQGVLSENHDAREINKIGSESFKLAKEDRQLKEMVKKLSQREAKEQKSRLAAEKLSAEAEQLTQEASAIQAAVDEARHDLDRQRESLKEREGKVKETSAALWRAVGKLQQLAESSTADVATALKEIMEHFRGPCFAFPHQ